MMNHTAAGVVAGAAFAVATMGVWFAQKWRGARTAQAEWAAQIALANALKKGPDDIVDLRYSWLNTLSALRLDGWEDVAQLDVSYNQITTLGLKLNTPLSQLVYLNISGNVKLNNLVSIDVLAPTLRFLYAVKCNLSDISTLNNFAVLEVLDVSKNILTAVPGRLPALSKLNLQGNLISSLPAELCNSLGLKELNLHGLQLKSLPNDFTRLTNLEKLSLRANKLGHVRGFEHLVKLVSLDMTKPGNAITFGLCDFTPLRSMTQLNLAGVKITEIPESILSLPSLFYLDLVQDAITSVPSSDVLLTHQVPWRRLNLAFNSLTEFPVSVLHLPGLEQLCVRNNMFEIPKEMEVLDPEEALRVWRKQHGVNISSSRRTSASSETMASLVTNLELFQNEAPSVEECNVQESIWYDMFSYRSEERPALPIPDATLDLLGRELLLDRILGCVYGNALGDAFGLATEFMPKDMANFYYDQERGLVPENFVADGHRANWQSGDWTDDTDQMVLIMDNLVKHKGVFNPTAYGEALKYWVNHGYAELGDSAGAGCGRHTYDVISHSSFKTKPLVASQAVWEKSDRKSAPNGAVMRTAVLGIAQFWNSAAVVADATLVAQVTHYDPRCVASAVAVSVAIAALLGSDPAATYEERVALAFECAEQAIQPIIATCPEDQQDEFTRHMHAKTLKELYLCDNKTMGYTLKTLGAAFWALRQARSDSFEHIITQVTLEAGDADTNCAVAGALVGALLGYRSLPARWIAKLEHPDWLNTKIKSFLDLYGICANM